MARVIINADDFGLDVGTNLAICDAFKNTTISSTSLMANMPGFDHALEQIQIGKIDKKRFELEALRLLLPYLDRQKNPRRKPIRLIGIRIFELQMHHIK